MLPYIIRRIIWGVLVVFGVVLVTYLFLYLLPGGPFDIAGEDLRFPEHIIKIHEKKYGVDQPFWIQFGHYTWGIVRGDLGPSFHSRTQTVNEVIAQTMPISAQLGLLSIALALLIGFPAGVVAALYHNTWIDYTSSAVAIIGLAVPNLVLGPLLIWIFGLKLGWLPVAGWGVEYPDLYLGFLPPIDAQFWKHAILPTIALGTALSASIARLTRAGLLEVVREDYIRTARAKGLTRSMVITTHAIKNAMIPTLTVLGPMIATMVTGTLVIERIFGIHGMGQALANAIHNRDYTVITGISLCYAVVLVAANLAVDVCYALIDPRIRLD